MKSKARFCSLLSILTATTALWLIAFTVNAQNLYVANGGGTTIGEYNAGTGAAINTSFITGLSQPRGVLISGNTLYVADDGTSNTIKAYNATTGAPQAGFATITSLSNPEKMVVIGTNLYVVNFSSGTVGKYDALTGVVINATFITGLSSPFGMASSGNTLYVDDYYNTRINEYDATTGTLSANSIVATGSVYDIAVTGGVLYAANYNDQGVDTFNLSTGAVIAKPFISGLNLPRGLAIAGNTLFVTNGNSGTVGAYNLSTGNSINTALVSGLSDPRFITVSSVPEPSAWTLLGVAGIGGIALVIRSRLRVQTAL